MDYKELVGKDRIGFFLMMNTETGVFIVECLFIRKGKIECWSNYVGDDPCCVENGDLETYKNYVYVEIKPEFSLYSVLNKWKEEWSKVID